MFRLNRSSGPRCPKCSQLMAVFWNVLSEEDMNVEARVICRPCSTKLIDEMEARPDWRAPVITRLDVARTMQFCGSQTGGEE